MPNNKFKDTILDVLKTDSGYDIPSDVFDEKIKTRNFVRLF